MGEWLLLQLVVWALGSSGSSRVSLPWCVAGAWTRVEEDRVLQLHAATPGRWAEISRGLGGGARHGYSDVLLMARASVCFCAYV